MNEKFQRAKWPEDTAERILDMRQLGASWAAVGKSFGVDIRTIRNKAIKLGLLVPRKNRRFTSGDDAMIRADYLAHADLEETARKIGCSYGVLRQRIFHHHKDLLRTVRTPASTRAINKYGIELLQHGRTPQEAAKNIREKVIVAKAAARVAAINAKNRQREQVVSVMIEQVRNGKPRDEAIFEARSLGVTLERIAECFDLTRERIRQICDAQAFRMAIDPSLKVEPQEFKRDYLFVGTSA